MNDPHQRNRNLTGLDAPPSLVVVTCAVFRDEIASLCRDRPHVRGVYEVEQGLHDDPPKLRQALQAMVERVEAERPEAQAIVLGYGLCSRGIEGVRTQRCQLVIARAHDCITLLLGSKERYQQEVTAHPGTYWYSPGWNSQTLMPGPKRFNTLRDRYVTQYGEDNADYLMETEQHWFTSYQRAAYVQLTLDGIDHTPHIDFTQRCAQWLGWQYEILDGDATLLEDLLDGRWDDERFLVLQPGQAARASADDRILIAETPA